MWSKSQVAFLFTCERLEELAGRNCTCWTFTCADVLQKDRDYSLRWNALWKRIAAEFPAVQGVRVYELHPGGHGIHVHAIFSSYLRVERVRALAGAAGWGRVHVFHPRRSWSRYLAKHLRKSSLGKFNRGTRKWGCCKFQGNRVCDIRVDSDLAHNMKVVRSLNPGRAVSGDALDQVIRYTMLWGRM